MPLLTPEQTADLLASHEPMCWWVARRVGRGLSEDDVEDLAAEVRLLFVSSASTFDPAAGTAFGTYAVPFAVRHAIRVARRIRAGGVRVPLNYAVEGVPRLVSASTRIGKRRLVDLLLARPCGGDVEAADFWDQIANRYGLTDREREVLLLVYRDGVGATELAARWSGDRSKVYRLVASAIEKIRRATEPAKLAG